MGPDAVSNAGQNCASGRPKRGHLYLDCQPLEVILLVSAEGLPKAINQLEGKDNSISPHHFMFISSSLVNPRKLFFLGIVLFLFFFFFSFILLPPHPPLLFTFDKVLLLDV
ncbi:hypothetical protein CEXT_615821 [Caerostris extrusa]|uniref:Uncharacterized protein n=1 Tax=Caerostris extrusa TaxID=172846 RepID=A0AAV4SJJ7_CAEEX|nr:hypothetical protein CEXT_615821 [Caerostris extrusa]